VYRYDSVDQRSEQDWVEGLCDRVEASLNEGLLPVEVFGDTRLFRTEMGRSPARYYLEIRLDRARHLLVQSSMPVVEVAVACGFVSASHFSKCYRELYNRSPQQERAERKLTMSTNRTGIVV